MCFELVQSIEKDKKHNTDLIMTSSTESRSNIIEWMCAFLTSDSIDIVPVSILPAPPDPHTTLLPTFEMSEAM